MKVYGDNDYKGYLYSKKMNSKHYITAIDVDVSNSDRVKIWYSDKSGSSILNYKVGTNKNIDIACKTWAKEREKQGRRVDPDLFDIFKIN